jgi:DNA-binding transcriptional MerR regulator
MSQRLYKISEIAAKHGLTLRTLRFWEDQDLIHPERKGTMRLYTDADDARVGRIAQLRTAGFSIEDICLIFKLEECGDLVSAKKVIEVALDRLIGEAEARGKALLAIGSSVLGLAA